MVANSLRFVASTFTMLCVIGYGIMLCRLYALPALAADEIAYFVWADHSRVTYECTSWISALARPNMSGYGNGYWITYVQFIQWFGTQAVWVMRGLACAAMLSIPVAVLMASGTRRVVGWLACFCWLSMPIAWWTGKVSGPDTFAMTFIVWGNLIVLCSAVRWAPASSQGLKEFIASDSVDGHPAHPSSAGLIQEPQLAPENTARREMLRLSLGWFFIGLAIALKLTMLPGAIFAFTVLALNCLRSPRRANFHKLSRQIFCMATGGLIGFFAGCPIVLFDLRRALKEWNALPVGRSWDLEIAISMLNNATWTWDGVLSGGLAQWSFALPLLGLFALVISAINIRVGIALVFSFVICWAIISARGATLGWYWFGWIPLIPCALIAISIERMRFCTLLVPILGALVFLNVFSQRAVVEQQINNIHDQCIALSSLAELDNTLAASIRPNQYDVVIDHSEVSHLGHPTLAWTQANDITHTSPPEFSVHEIPTYSDITLATQKAVQRVVMSDAFVRLIALGADGTKGKSTLVLVSNRLASHQPFADFESYLTNAIIPNSPSGTTFRRLANLPAFSVYGIETLRNH